MSPSDETGGVTKQTRKESISSEVSGASHQTDQSQSSSVIINKAHSGISKQISQPMINGMKTEDSKKGFNANEIFQERNKIARPDIFADINSIKEANNREELDLNFSCKDEYKDRAAMESGDDSFYDFDALEETDIVSDNDEIASNQTEYEYDEEDEKEYVDDDVSESEVLPISPPRSPPSELEPDKHYGLCYFSGPDPQHCTLTRNEAVYLLDDQDNYWWLIQKLSKEERLRSHEQYNFSPSEQKLGLEDGKIGFVPAECLETYWERLARLNCFKNEEVERNIKMQQEMGSRESKAGLSIANELTESSTGKKNSNKMVSFENIGIMISETDEEYRIPVTPEGLEIPQDKELSAIQIENDSVNDFEGNYSELPLVIKKSRNKPTTEEGTFGRDDINRKDKTEHDTYAGDDPDDISFRNPYTVASEGTRRSSSQIYQHENLSLSSVSSASLSYLSGDLRQQPSDFKADNTTNESLSFRNSQVFDQMNQDLFGHHYENIKDDFSCTDRSSDLLDQGIDPSIEKCGAKTGPIDYAKSHSSDIKSGIDFLPRFNSQDYSNSSKLTSTENGIHKFNKEKEKLNYDNATVLDELDQLVDNLATLQF